MTLSSRAARIAVAISSALLVAYAVIWTQLSPVDIGRSDFTAFYVGGALLRQGHGTQLYDEALQAPLHAHLIAPDHEGNLPFVDPPPAAALVLPVTLLSLDAAYRVWSLLMLAALAGAVAVAVKAARPTIESESRRGWVAGIAALAGAGTLLAWSEGQWAALAAMGLAAAYALWRRNKGSPTVRDAALGAAALIGCAVIGKPQLTLGVVAFMIGWRRTGLLRGCLAAIGGLSVASLALVGATGINGFVRIVARSAAQWDPHLMLGSTSLGAAFGGSGAPAAAITSAIALGACAGAYVLGMRVRRDPRLLGVGLAGAAAFSLVAAPHAYLHDLALLAPAAAWCIAGASESGVSARIPLALWALLTVTGFADLAANGTQPIGSLSAYVLAAAGAAVLATTRNRRGAGLGYRAGDEAAVGAMAHGLRRW